MVREEAFEEFFEERLTRNKQKKMITANDMEMKRFQRHDIF